jgi:hypothetical protein
MDPITILLSIGGVYRYAVTARFTYPAWEVLTLQHLRQNYGSLRPKFGRLQSLALIIIFPGADQIVDRVEKHVLGAKTDAVKNQHPKIAQCWLLMYVLKSQLVNSEDGSRYL